MSQRNPLRGKKNRLRGDEPTDAQANPHLIPGLAEQEGTPVVARPLPLLEIWPDLAQPRRALPMSVRGSWDGSPQGISDVLSNWKIKANSMVQQSIDPKGVLNGGALIEVDESAPEIMRQYMKVLLIAQDIQRNGLTNPITVVETAGGYRIHTGERRTLAYHMLRMYVDRAKYDRLPARVVEANVWTQISENTNREDMNAVSMARSLALLLMDMYPEEDFGTVTEMTTDDGCDRPFYAQVVDHSIRRGLGEQVMQTLNTTNRSRISHYRNILRLPDELWTQADQENWPEGRIRAWFQEQNAPDEPEEMFTTVNISGDATPPPATFGPHGQRTYPASDAYDAPTPPPANTQTREGLKPSPPQPAQPSSYSPTPPGFEPAPKPSMSDGKISARYPGGQRMLTFLKGEALRQDNELLASFILGMINNNPDVVRNLSADDPHGWAQDVRELTSVLTDMVQVMWQDVDAVISEQIRIAEEGE